MRGLKLEALPVVDRVTVASFTDAWIETTVPKRAVPPLVVASFTDAWIETEWDAPV